MSDINVLFIYLGCVIIGFIAGSVVYYKKYGKMILEVLDNLKFTDKISPTEYEYYKERFIKEKDSLKNIRDFMKKMKERKDKEKEKDLL